MRNHFSAAPGWRDFLTKKKVHNAKGLKSGAEKVSVGRKHLVSMPFLSKGEIEAQNTSAYSQIL